jgi:hypothetical protein
VFLCAFVVKTNIMKKKILDQIQLDIQNLAVKKLWKINENGNKVKVRRNAESEYSIYLDGNYITTLADWEDTFSMAKSLLLSL